MLMCSRLPTQPGEARQPPTGAYVSDGSHAAWSDDREDGTCAGKRGSKGGRVAELRDSTEARRKPSIGASLRPGMPSLRANRAGRPADTSKGRSRYPRTYRSGKLQGQQSQPGSDGGYR